MFAVRILRDAEKDLAKIPTSTLKKIFPAIKALAVNPRPHGCKKLKGMEEYLWRIRVGDYRVVYSIDDEIKLVEVRKAGHRKDIYE
ncbi:MAG: type II toxin-antitoxin system RelE/ParE family toxin [Bacteroidetes bacterium]|nr:type II toxin-antitoxin system RelE/ParE family toxin [Bacteroidota bacterium]